MLPKHCARPCCADNRGDRGLILFRTSSQHRRDSPGPGNWTHSPRMIITRRCCFAAEAGCANANVCLFFFKDLSLSLGFSKTRQKVCWWRVRRQRTARKIGRFNSDHCVRPLDLDQVAPTLLIKRGLFLLRRRPCSQPFGYYGKVLRNSFATTRTPNRL